MREGWVTMSVKKLNRLEILEKVKLKELTQAEAAHQLGLSRKQVNRLSKKYRQEGAKSLVSRRRGQPSSNRLDAGLKSEAMEIVRERYADFGPTLAHEKLTEIHHLNLSVESVRKLMIQEGLWKNKRRREMVVHQQRNRRSCLGELIQMDGSPHDWFESRGERCCLLVWIDDATSRLMHLHFEKSETTRGYWIGMKEYLKKHGRPICLYTDRHGIFRQNQGSDLKEQDDTQFFRSLKELEIKLICANSPQAKGRVERANSTLQDRLVKELRLQKINDMVAANIFLPTFMADYNRRFSVPAKSATDSHQKNSLKESMLDFIFSWRSTRKLSQNLEFSYRNVIYQIQSEHQGRRLRGARVEVRKNLEGHVSLWHEGKSLCYTSYVKQTRREEPVGSKEKDAQVDEAIKIRRGVQVKPGSNHPWRTPLKPGVSELANQSLTKQ